MRRIGTPLIGILGLVVWAYLVVSGGQSLADNPVEYDMEDLDVPDASELFPQEPQVENRPARPIEPEVFSGPLVDEATALERIEPREPLSTVYTERPAATKIVMLHRPLSVEAGIVSFGAERQIRFAGVEPTPLSMTCGAEGGTPWPCGAMARTQQRLLIRNRSLACEAIGSDWTGQIETRCFVGAMEIAAWLALHGWAEASEGSTFTPLTDEARRQGKGIFATAQSQPADNVAERP